ncbi:MAG: hypothetical protein KDJ27_00515 [Gammaproteobacteria bacterium]|nr:hypothetical protein [Gammaproteobacteria bacterium]
MDAGVCTGVGTESACVHSCAAVGRVATQFVGCLSDEIGIGTVISPELPMLPGVVYAVLGNRGWFASPFHNA